MVGSVWQRLVAVAACASVMGIAACGGQDENSGDSAIASSGDVARDSAAGAASPGATTPGAATSPAGGTGAMSIAGGDPEIIQVLAVVDQSEIEVGRLAQRQAQNAQVKSFARELVTAHQRSLQKDRQLAKAQNYQLMTMDSAGLRAATGTDTNRAATGATASGSTATGTQANMGGPNSVAGQLHTMHMQAMQRVRSLQGAAFDSAFMNAQVMGHQQVLDLLQRSQGQAQNADVQQHLTQATTEVQNHLQRAQQIQQSLMSGGTGGASGGDTASRTKTGSDTARRTP
jgi:putative membrane protein